MPLNFQQRLKFQPKPEKLLDEFNLNGGLKTDEHESKLLPNESPDLANVVFDTTVPLKTRNGYLRYNTDPVEATSDEANTGASTGVITLDAVGDYAAQTFQVGTQADFLQVNLYLAMTNSGEEQYIKVELWSGATGPSAVLEEAQILLVSGTGETTYKFRVREPYTLAATTEYAIVIKPYVRGSTQTVNSVGVHRTGSAYGSGAAYISTDSGLSWSAVASTDLKFDVLTGTSTGCSGLLRYYSTTGIQQLIAKFGTSLYRGNDGTGVMTAITLGSGVSLTAGNFVDWAVVNDTLLVVDGTNKIQKYRGSTNANYTTGTITATNGSTGIVGSGTSWATTTNAEIGEYIKLPNGKWYKITAVADNTHLTIEVSYQGSTLSGQTYTISPWGEVQGRLDSTAPGSLVRPTPSFIASHINRVWALQDNSLYFSALDTTVSGEHFNDWDTSNNAGQINVPAGKGDSSTGLYSINGSLYVFQRNAIWVVLGSSPANFELRNVSNEIGLIDRRTVVEYDAYLLFYSGLDIYIFDGSNLRNLTKDRVHSLIASFANKTSPVATLWDTKYILSYTPTGEDKNSEAIYYDITKDKFGKLENVFASAWSVWNGDGDTGQVYFGSSRHGTIYRWDTGGHDDGYEITTRYSTPSIGFSSGMNDKTVKKVYLQQIALGGWDMSVSQYADITRETTTSTINLATGTGALWGVAQWGVDEWADESTLLTSRITEFQGTAKYFRYAFFQAGYNEGIQVLGLNVTARQRRLQ